MNSFTGTPRVAERVHDGPGPERGGLQQGPVGVLGAGGQGLANNHPGQFVVHQHRTVPRVPVQGDQPVCPDGLPGGEFGQVFVDAETRRRRSLVVFGWNPVFENQPKMSPTPDWPAS